MLLKGKIYGKFNILCYVRLQEVAFMHALVVTLLVIVSIGLIVVVLLQAGKSAGLSGSISGGAEQLFGKQKARGIDLILHRITIVFSFLFFILAIAVTYFKV
jgi:preprotein translocase subunit SecG